MSLRASSSSGQSSGRGREILLLALWTFALLVFFFVVGRQWFPNRFGRTARPQLSTWQGSVLRAISGEGVQVQIEILPSDPASSEALVLKSYVARDFVHRTDLEVCDEKGRSLETSWRPRLVPYSTTSGRFRDLAHDDLMIHRRGDEKTIVVSYRVAALSPSSGWTTAFSKGDKILLPGRVTWLVPVAPSGYTFSISADSHGSAGRSLFHIQATTNESGDFLAGELPEPLASSVLVGGPFDRLDFRTRDPAPEVFVDRDLGAVRDPVVSAMRRIWSRAASFGQEMKRNLTVVLFSTPPVSEGLSSLGIDRVLAVDLDEAVAHGAWRWERIVRAMIGTRLEDSSLYRPQDAWIHQACQSYLATVLLRDEGLVDFDLNLRRLWRSYVLSRVEDETYRLSSFRSASGRTREFLGEVVGPLTLHGVREVLALDEAPFLELLTSFVTDEERVSFGWINHVKERIGVDLRPFYRNFVSGFEWIPSGEDLELTAPVPFDADGGAGLPVGQEKGWASLGLYVTAKTFGDRSACDGCPETEDRIASRGAMVVSQAVEGESSLIVDCGDMMPRDAAPAMTPEWLEEISARFRDMAGIGVRAFVPTVRDLRWGEEVLRSLADEGEVSFLSCNLLDATGSPMFASWVELDWGGVSVALIGVTAPEIALLASRRWERALSRFRLEDPVVSVVRVAEELRPRVGLLFVIGELDPYAVRRLLRARSGLIDGVVSTDSSMDRLRRVDSSGMIGETAVMYVSGTPGTAMDRCVLWANQIPFEADGDRDGDGESGKPRLDIKSWTPMHWDE